MPKVFPGLVARAPVRFPFAVLVHGHVEGPGGFGLVEALPATPDEQAFAPGWCYTSH